MWAENADVIGSCDLCLWAATGTGQIDADIYPKERMAMAQMADFPIILRVRCTVVEEQLAERFRVQSFGTRLLLGNRQNTRWSQRFSPKASQLRAGLRV